MNTYMKSMGMYGDGNGRAFADFTPYQLPGPGGPQGPGEWVPRDPNAYEGGASMTFVPNPYAWTKQDVRYNARNQAHLGYNGPAHLDGLIGPGGSIVGPGFQQGAGPNFGGHGMLGMNHPGNPYGNDAQSATLPTTPPLAAPAQPPVMFDPSVGSSLPGAKGVGGIYSVGGLFGPNRGFNDGRFTGSKF